MILWLKYKFNLKKKKTNNGAWLERLTFELSVLKKKKKKGENLTKFELFLRNQVVFRMNVIRAVVNPENNVGQALVNVSSRLIF